jgi:hypothetical protein
MVARNLNRRDMRELLEQVRKVLGQVGLLNLDSEVRDLQVTLTHGRDETADVWLKLLKGGLVVLCPREQLLVVANYLLGLFVTKAVRVPSLSWRLLPDSDLAVLVLESNDQETLVDLVETLSAELELANLQHTQTDAETMELGTK